MESQELPPHIEARVDPATGRIYYLDHEKGTTSWEVPTESLQNVIVVPPSTQRKNEYVPYEQQGTGLEAMPSKKANGFKQISSRSYALSKSVLIGQFCPSLLSKSGELTLDGRRVYLVLRRGVLTIYASREKKDDIIFCAPMKYIFVIGDASTRKNRRQVKKRGRDIAPNEIALYVEPEALNQEVNTQSTSGMHMGWFPGLHLRVGHTVGENGLTAHHIQRQNFSLFASTPTDKQNWRITLNTAANSLRNWGYVSHELSDSWAYASDNTIQQERTTYYSFSSSSIYDY